VGDTHISFDFTAHALRRKRKMAFSAWAPNATERILVDAGVEYGQDPIKDFAGSFGDAPGVARAEINGFYLLDHYTQPAKTEAVSTAA